MAPPPLDEVEEDEESDADDNIVPAAAQAGVDEDAATPGKSKDSFFEDDEGDEAGDIFSTNSKAQTPATESTKAPRLDAADPFGEDEDEDDDFGPPSTTATAQAPKAKLFDDDDDDDDDLDWLKN